MGSIFLSYARGDRAYAETLARVFEDEGHDVWWDRHLDGGEEFSAEIEAALDRSDVVLVAWSKDSVKSRWVRDEAAVGGDRGRLLPITIDGTRPPMGFRQFHTLDLTDWTGSKRDPRTSDLLHSLERRLEGQPTPRTTSANDRAIRQRSPPSGYLSRRRLLVAVAIALTVAFGAAFYFFRSHRIAFSEPVAMAVLPFDAVPADSTNSPFAEGVAEEIHDQLGHNPKLRLVGRTSAEAFRNSDADAPTIGKKLHVAFLLDGTVRRAGDQVKVAVALVRASDGIELWRHSYSGKLDDIFAIQQSIGQQVEGQLRAQFVGPRGISPSTLATSGEVYGYYLTARGLTRSFEAAKVETAIDLLHRALKLDPNYAPAWAQLAIATRYRSYLQGKLADEDAERVREQAIDIANKAIALAPQLAEAHLSKAIALEALDDTGDEGKSELLIAARLDPNNADTWAELALVYQWAGYFPEELAAQRRRIEIDPVWAPGLFHASELAWQLGYEEESLKYVRQVERDSPGSVDAHLLRANVAYLSGNLSGALKEALIARKLGSAGDRRFADRQIAQALRAAGFLDRARPLWYFDVDDRLWTLWNGKALPSPTINQLYRDTRVAWANQMVTFAVLKTLVAAGRSPEAVALYHRRFSSADDMLRYPSGHLGLLEDGSTIALALSDSGQKDAALHLLNLLRREADDRIARGPVPRNYHYYYAMILAVSGDNEGALKSLEQSARRGWYYAEEKSLPDLAMEPAFRSLIRDKRFQRILNQQRAWQERERAKIGPLLGQVGQP